MKNKINIETVVEKELKEKGFKLINNWDGVKLYGRLYERVLYDTEKKTVQARYNDRRGKVI